MTLDYAKPASAVAPPPSGEAALRRDAGRIIGAAVIGAVAWAVFLLLPGLFNPRITSMGVEAIVGDLVGIPHRWTNALFCILVFYLNYLYFIPRLYLRHRYLLFALSGLGCAVAFIGLNAALHALHFSGMAGAGVGGPPSNNIVRWLGPSHNTFLFLMAWGASFTLRLYRQWRLVAQEKAQAEIAFLKAQMAPHFLFNTLNSIYSLALAKSDEAPEAVLKLSRLLRYNVSEATGTRVTLTQELDYIRAYMDLQRLRFSERVNLWCEISGEEDGLEIEPFLLIPFIENAFKHGVNSEENSDIQVFIRIRGADLHMDVSNRKVSVRQREENTGVGIANTRQRLELLYGGRYELEIEDGKDYYTINLQLTLE